MFFLAADVRLETQLEFGFQRIEIIGRERVMSNGRRSWLVVDVAGFPHQQIALPVRHQAAQLAFIAAGLVIQVPGSGQVGALGDRRPARLPAAFLRPSSGCGRSDTVAAACALS